MESLAIKNGDCWDWRFAVSSNGYGSVWAPEYGRPVGVARYTLEILQGRRGDAGLQVCHSCDRTICFNPKHLRWGTPSVNQKDRRDRNRANGLQKLTVETADAIRREFIPGQPNTVTAALGAKYGVSRKTVHNIVAGKAWAP